MPFIIAIDGPSGAGKSTLGRMLASELGLLYLDTGAMYRAAALAAIEGGIDLCDASQFDEAARIVERAKIELTNDAEKGGAPRVWLDGRDVSHEIRDERISQAASIVSTIPLVRKDLVRRQREMSLTNAGVVLDGRDIGTVVFPNADVKFFLTAVPEERAKRRFAQTHTDASVVDQTASAAFAETLHDIITRDTRDSTRADSPLAIAEDAIVIDTTDLSINDVFEKLMFEINERR